MGTAGDAGRNYAIAVIAGAVVALIWPWVVAFYIGRRVKERRDAEVDEVERQLAEERKTDSTRRYSQRNVAAASPIARPPSPPAGRASATAAPRSPTRARSGAPRDSGAAGRAPGDRGERRRQAVDRQDDPAEDQEREEQDVGEGEHRLGAERAGQEQPEPGEGERPEEDATTSSRPRTRPAGAASRGQRSRPPTSSPTWTASTTRTVSEPGDDELAAAERRAAEPLQDAVRAVVGGRDPEADEARRDDPEGDRARQQEVDRPAGPVGRIDDAAKNRSRTTSGSRSSRTGSRRAGGRAGAPSRSSRRSPARPGRRAPASRGRSGGRSARPRSAAPISSR